MRTKRISRSKIRKLTRMIKNRRMQVQMISKKKRISLRNNNKRTLKTLMMREDLMIKKNRKIHNNNQKHKSKEKKMLLKVKVKIFKHIKILKQKWRMI